MNKKLSNCIFVSVKCPIMSFDRLCLLRNKYLDESRNVYKLKYAYYYISYCIERKDKILCIL